MPRIDRTFTDADLVRFWVNNLSVEEQQNVSAFFFFIQNTGEDSDLAYWRFLGTMLGIIPIVGDAINIAIESIAAQRRLRGIVVSGQIAVELATRSGVSIEAAGDIFGLPFEEPDPVEPPPEDPDDIE